jgi:hypothetical protein
MLNRTYGVRLALCLLASLVVVGCGSNGTKTHPSDPAAPTPKSTPSAIATPDPTPSPSAATVTVCQATAITGAAGQPDGAAGTIGNVIVLTNTGTQPCALIGYPTLQVVASGLDLPTHQMDGDNWLASLSSTPQLVTILARGGQASVVFVYNDNTGVAMCPGATQLEIGLPGDGGTVTSRYSDTGYPIAPCADDSLRVYPIIAGAVNLNS